MKKWLFCALLVCLCMPAGSESVFSLSTSAPDAEAFVLEVVSYRYENGQTPRIYLYHTHTCEAYDPSDGNAYQPTETWRTADPEFNVVRVGEELSRLLTKAGFLVVHDRQDYERPDLSAAYGRSLEGLLKTRDAPFDLYIDLHRDSYSAGNGPNAADQGGISYARVLFLVGKGTGQVAEDEKPDWKNNEQLAQHLSDAMNQYVADISRGVSLKSGRYNQHAVPNCLLVEVGNNHNTLTQALASMEPLSMAICRYFDTVD